MTELNDLTQAANLGDFEAEIVEGKMIINPSDAGIQLFAYVAMAEDQIEKAELETVTAQEIIENLRQENAELRDLLESTTDKLFEYNEDTLAEDIIRKLYPVTGTFEDGTEVEFTL